MGSGRKGMSGWGSPVASCRKVLSLGDTNHLTYHQCPAEADVKKPYYGSWDMGTTENSLHFEECKFLRQIHSKRSTKVLCRAGQSPKGQRGEMERGNPIKA